MHVGSTQKLVVLERVRGGYLVGDPEAPAFLSRLEAPDGIEAGEEVSVFLYTAKDGSYLATTRTPFVQVGTFGALEVVDVAGPGAYLDWGLDRDLLVPRALQHRELSIGDIAVVAVDVDDRDRVFASTKLAEFFDRNVGDLSIGQEVELLVYGFNTHGALMVVDQRYTGLAYHNEVFRELRVGERMTGWVSGLREDGRVDVVLQRARRAGTDDAVDVVLHALEAHGGFLPLHDKSSPADIRKTLEMSKKVFKKAVGSLYKARRIRIERDGIQLVEPSEE